MPGALLRTDDLATTPLRRPPLEAVRPLLERALGLDAVEARYLTAQTLSGSFPVRALSALGVTLAIEGELDAIPSSGPLLIVANHPLGALDGLAVAAAVERVRPDVRLVANRLLAGMPELAAISFFVDPFGNAGAVARSRAGLREAHLWLRRGGALVVFPAGEVAYGPTRQGTHRDSAWKDTVGRLALQTGASVVPIHVHGANSALFYLAGHLHGVLRTLLLPRELLKKTNQRLTLTVGAPMARHTITTFGDAGHVTEALRSAVDALATSRPTDESRVAAEVHGLPRARRLLSSGRFDVYAAAADDIPHALREIGRQREIAFRGVGEGTGREMDLDRFDQHYTHIFLWDRTARLIAGAYRAGDVRSIVQARGVDGLYTRQLFRFDERFVDQLGPALELGRSWVRRDYQKNHSALLLLWKGIGRFITRQARTPVVFGPVSISARYSDTSHALLMAFLEQHYLEEPLAALVAATHPRTRAPRPAHSVVATSIEDADRLVAMIEGDGKGMPVLLRQYLKLDARVIGFNVDPEFGDALDALMLVDLSRVSPRILSRYLGVEAAAFTPSGGSQQRAA